MGSDDEEAPDVVDNAVLGLAMMWADKTPNPERLLEKHFDCKEVHDAAMILWEKTKLGKKPVKHQQNDKLEKTAKELMVVIKKMKDLKDDKVRIMVSPDSLAMVSFMESTWGDGDEASTAARLLNLERQMNEMRVELAKGINMMSNPPPKQYAEVVARSGRQNKVVTKPVPTVRVQLPHAEVQHEESEVDTEQVQVSEEDYQIVRKKRKAPRKVQYGTGQASSGGAGAEAAPYEVWIGNTHPDSTKEIIAEVLMELGKKVDGDNVLMEDLQVLECECLTKPRTDGRKPYTKQWRVQVANRFREHMKRPEAFQVGWSSRRYFPARPRVPDLHLASGARNGVAAALPSLSE